MSKPSHRQSPLKHSDADHRRGEIKVNDVCLAGLMAIVVALPLLPSEGAITDGSLVCVIGCLLLLATIWCAARLWATVTNVDENAKLVCSATEIAVAGLALCLVLSASMMIRQGNARYTINAVWVWLSLLLLFLLARQLLRSPTSCRAACAVMIAVATGLSLYGLYQHTVLYPSYRALWSEYPERVLELAGVEAEPGSPEWRNFADRLKSTEPTGTFALANSLAGVLSPWLIFSIGVAITERQGVSKRWPALATLTFVALVIVGCLILTKSRTAYLAAGCGSLLLAIYVWLKGRHVPWWIPVGAGCAVVLMVIAAVVTRGLDLEVFSEAPLSVKYRLQYWQSSALMIAGHPLWGVGPGNFQGYYTQFKLPEASETIADPHNFVLDIWANAGTPALLGLFAVGICFVRQVRRYGSAGRFGFEPVVPPARSVNKRDFVSVCCGAIAGLPLAWSAGFLIGYRPDPIALGFVLASGVFVVSGLYRWILDGELPASIPLIAIAVLLLGLMAAGGIAFAGVAQTLWLLAAITLNQLEALAAWQTAGNDGPSEDATSASDRNRCVGAFAAASLVAITGLLAFYFSCFNPVLLSQAFRTEAELHLQMGNQSLAIERLEQATQADPLSHKMWLQLASVRGVQKGVERFKEATTNAIQSDLRSSMTHQQAGTLYAALYRNDRNVDHLQRAVQLFERARDLYPASNIVWARLAWLYSLAGKESHASEAARRAIELDKVNPHEEKKLGAQTLRSLGARADESAEQQMFKLIGGPAVPDSR